MSTSDSPTFDTPGESAPHAIPDATVTTVATDAGIPTHVLETDLAETADTLRSTDDVVWQARYGSRTDAIVIYDADNALLLQYPDDDALPLAASKTPATHDALKECHQRAADRIAREADVQLSSAHPHIVVRPSDTLGWSEGVAAEYDRPYAPIEYEVNFASPKWDDYDVSACAWAEIPGRHGTLRKEVRVQGFPTHRSTETDTVTLHTTLTHLETGHEFESDTESYDIPSAADFDSYPHIPHVRRSVYNVLFADAGDYTAVIENEFDLCERCGTYDRPSENIYVDTSIDPDGGWEREYCTECYARRLHDEYGVTQTVGRIYALRSTGIAYTTIADWLDHDVSFVRRMAENLEEAVHSGDSY